ncbi:MAG TPA: PGF-pre-PGF domain-containing protein [archaeon]|nr:PGF-pre-PGF domain-containing protein [archaeon]
MNSRATSIAEASKIILLTLFFFSLLSAVAFSDRISNNTYIVDIESSGLAAEDQLNSTTFNVSISGSAVGGQINSTTYNVSFGILAGAVAPTTTSTTTTTAQGGAGGVVSYSLSNNKVSAITVDPGANVSIRALVNVSVSLINFIPNRTLANAAVEVKKILPSALPSTITVPTQKVFEYIEIIKTNIPENSLRIVKMKFFVTKTWLTENKLTEDRVVLQRYESGNWKKLPTTKLSTDAEKINYESDSPGLSLFAISGLAEGEAAPTSTTVPSEVTTTLPSTGATISPPATLSVPDIVQSLSNPENSGLIILALVILAIIVFVFFGKKIFGGKIQQKAIQTRERKSL